MLQALTDFHHTNDTIRKIQSLLETIESSGAAVEFCWSPGHVGIAGNEEADRKAKNAVTNGEEIQMPITINEFSSLIKLKQQQRWQNQWTNTESKLKRFKPTIGPIKIFPTENRKEEVIIRRARLGHSKLTHEFIVKGEDRPICTSCNMNLTIMKHFLTECRGKNLPLIGSNQDKLEDEESVKKVIEYVKRTKVDI